MNAKLAFMAFLKFKKREGTNMKKWIALLLTAVLVCSLSACGTPAAEESESQSESQTSEETVTSDTESTPEALPQLRVGMECAYAPNNWQEDTATDTNYPIENVPGAYAEGYDVQIAKIIAEDAGYELVIVKMAWSGLIEALNQGQIDAIIAGMADTAERRESINFSEPYHVTEYGVMVNADSAYASATSINDFSGASILGQKDTMLDTVIDQMEGVNHLTPVDSVPNMISRLDQGTCDGIIVNVENSESYLASNPNFKVITFAEGDGFDLGFVGACVGLRKEDTDLLDAVNTALAGIDQETRDTLWENAVANQPK